MATSLTDYLKKYTDRPDSSHEKRKKKKKKPVHGAAVAPAKRVSGLVIHDTDAMWQKDVKDEEEDEEEEAEEDVPAVLTDIDTRAMERLAQLRARKPYISLGEDGSGWVEAGGVRDAGPPTATSGDLSPPRRGTSNDPPPPHPRHRQDSDGDLSPTGKGFPASLDRSPPRKRPRGDIRRTDPTSLPLGLSPPGHEGHDPRDLSPPHQDRHDSPGLSPPRRERHDSPDLSSPRPGRHGSPDLSPPRRGRHDSPDLSPPRRNGDGSADLSPPRRGRQQSGEAGLSGLVRAGPGPGERRIAPGRGQAEGGGDLSPPRKSSGGRGGRGGAAAVAGGGSEGDKDGGGRPRQMADGTVSGLRTGQEVKAELEEKARRDRARFASLDAEKTGRAAETVYRDKHGRRLAGLEEFMRHQAGKKEGEEEQQLEWGKGLVQKQQAAERAAEIEAEKHRPFARSRDDPELDRMYRERLRFGDPMAHLVAKKKGVGAEEEFDLPSLDTEAMRESGFIIPQEVPSHSWLKRGVAVPFNRYGIKPGRHWDGVDRSQGFEKTLFQHQNEKVARQQEAYMWSVADM